MNDSEKRDLKEMIAGELENGALENVKTLFQYNKELYHVLGALIMDERMRVRIGASILVEDLYEIKPEDTPLMTKQLLPLLKEENPNVRGDAAYLLGIIGGKEMIGFLTTLLQDTNHQVVAIAQDALEDIRKK